MEHILNIFDWLLYIWFAINILYLLVYSLASRRRDLPLPPPAKEHKRFAILIPAYREDAVIHECVHSCLEQDYPADCFDTVVISDRMQPETNASLAVLPVRLVEVHFEKSTKSKSLNAAMAAIGNDYDIALVLDADNVIPYDYLSDINDLFANPEVEIVQTHRSAKNLNNDMALLDAISEEINNTIFRLGHAKLGLSAALIGSGMAFRYDLFRDTMADIKAVGGFDRELELTLLYRGKRFYYVVYGLSLDMGAEVVAALGVARCRTARCRSQKVLHQPPGNGPAKDTLYIPADGRKHLQAEGSKQDLYTYQAWGGGKIERDTQ